MVENFPFSNGFTGDIFNYFLTLSMWTIHPDVRRSPCQSFNEVIVTRR